MSKDMSAAKSISPKTIHISYKFLYACLCVLVFALGVFVITYGFIGDYLTLRLYPVMRIFPIMLGAIIVISSFNMWLEWPAIHKRYFRPKRYTQLRH